MFDSTSNQPQTIERNGKNFECLVCRNQQFYVTHAQLNKAVTTFFNLDWTDRTATCLVCAECTYIHWFTGK
jgi:hypothetical protein